MWTLELFEKTRLGDLLDGTNLFTKEEVIEYARRQCAPRAAMDILGELDEEDVYEDVFDIWPDMPIFGEGLDLDDDDE